MEKVENNNASEKPKEPIRDPAVFKIIEEERARLGIPPNISPEEVSKIIDERNTPPPWFSMIDEDYKRPDIDYPPTPWPPPDKRTDRFRNKNKSGNIKEILH